MSRSLNQACASGQAFRLPYGDEVIHYTIAIRPTDNGKVLIKVHDDGRVVAHRPVSADLKAVNEAMRQRAAWVWQQLSEFRQYQRDIQPRQYLSGESHFYLGRRYVLKVMPVGEVSANSVEALGVKLMRGRFEVRVMQPDRAAVKQQLERWYQRKAGEVFPRRLQALLPQTPWVEHPPQLCWQKMQKRWGSCSTDNVLTLNTHLVKAPRDCIDYVILHELCHIREHNHGAAFYRLLKLTLPEWEARKTYLDQHAFRFLS